MPDLWLHTSLVPHTPEASVAGVTCPHMTVLDQVVAAEDQPPGLPRGHERGAGEPVQDGHYAPTTTPVMGKSQAAGNMIKSKVNQGGVIRVRSPYLGGRFIPGAQHLSNCLGLLPVHGLPVLLHTTR